MTKTVSNGHAANMAGVAAVDRALAIAKALEKARGPLTLSQIAVQTGLYKSSVLRLMTSLERSGLVVRRRDQSYVLGHFAFSLGKAYSAVSHLEETLLPLMQRLVDNGSESPSFHVVYDDTTRLCLMRLDSRHSTLDRVRAGDLLPIDRGAAGKLLRRPAPQAAVKAPEELLEFSFGERDPSCGAIAGPVFGPGPELLGVLSLSGPLGRFTTEAVQQMSGPLLAACEAATRELGAHWPVESKS
jgi:DNA-binding IclR family transcriptional regulator